MQLSKIDKRKFPNAWRLDEIFSFFYPPTFYLSFFTVVDDKLILGKLILIDLPLVGLTSFIQEDCRTRCVSRKMSFLGVTRLCFVKIGWS